MHIQRALPLILVLAPACAAEDDSADTAAWTTAASGTTGVDTAGGTDATATDATTTDATTTDETTTDATTTTATTSDPGSSGGTTGVGSTGGDPGCYWEEVNPDADVSDVEQSYAPSKWAETYFEVLKRRWPAGHDLLVMEQDDPYFGAFADTSSFSGLMDSVMTEVHEGTHGWDYGHATINDFAYYLRADLTFEPPKLNSFPRSEIMSMLVDNSTELYAGTYLTGEQGSRGLYELLDEMNCYINGMAGAAVVGEFIPWGFSGKDGAVAFLYYLELYLQRARTEYPALYAQMQAEPEYVELVEVQWLRTHFFLEYADAHSNLGIKDQEIRTHLHNPANMAEISMFIGKEVDASPCLP